MKVLGIKHFWKKMEAGPSSIERVVFEDLDIKEMKTLLEGEAFDSFVLNYDDLESQERIEVMIGYCMNCENTTFVIVYDIEYQYPKLCAVCLKTHAALLNHFL